MRAIHVCLLALAALPASAQTDTPVKVSGSFRSRLEVWDWFDAPGNDRYAFSGNILRVSFTQNFEKYDWQVELAAPFLLGLPQDSIAPGAQGQLGLGANYYAANDRNRNAIMVFPKQAFLRLKFGSQSLRVGRFEFSDGAETAPKDPTLAWVKRERVSQRLLGPFGWSHVGRSFDGLHYVATRGVTNVTVMGASPTRGAFQVDGWGWMKIGVLYGAVTQTRQSKSHASDWRLFGAYYHDGRNVLKTDNRPLPVRRLDLDDIRIGTFGGHVAHAITTAAGTFDLLGWAALETGSWGRQDHGAYGFFGEAGWQPAGVAWKPWVRAGYFRGSGDDDPNDGDHATFFQMLPTPRPYARTPFFDMINNEDIFAMAVLRPHSAVTVRPEFHVLNLTARNDLWYAGGGAFQPWTFGYAGRPSNGERGLANLYDISVDWAARKNLSITGYLGHAQGRGVVERIYPEGDSGNFGYLEVTVRF